MITHRLCLIKNLRPYAVILLFFIIGIATSCFAQDKIVAIVNKDVITQKDLNDFINFTRMQLASEFKPREAEERIQSIRPELLTKLIEDRLILQEAKRNNIKVDEVRIRARIEELKERYGSNTDFEVALRGQGLVQADIESRIREQMLMYNIIEFKVRSKIRVSPREVTAFYQENAAEFKAEAELQIESISTANSQIADEIFNSRKESKGLEALVANGLVEINKMAVNKGQLRRDIDDTVFKLNTGEMSKPIKINHKYYIFRLIDIIPARQLSLSEVRNGIYNLLFDKKMQEELTRWLDGLKKKSYIKIFEN